VIGNGNGIEPAFFGTLQDVQHTDGWLLVVRRSGGMQVEIDSPPGCVLGRGRRGRWSSGPARLPSRPGVARGASRRGR
jgi:hypothetical protein